LGLRCHLLWRESRIVRLIESRSGPQQKCQGWDGEFTVGSHCKVQGGVPFLVFAVNVCPVVEERLEEFGLSVASPEAQQGGLPLLVRGVDLNMMMMMMHWNPPSLLRLLTQDVFGITHTHALYRRSGQDHRATADRYPHRNTPRKGKTKPNNGCTKPHSSCSQGHGALQHMYSSEDRRRQGKLARSNLSPHRPHTITRLTINPGTRRSTSTHTHTQTVWRRQSTHRVSITRGGSSHSLCTNERHSLL
jgi:hypothetical protein